MNSSVIINVSGSVKGSNLIVDIVIVGLMTPV